MAQTSSTPSCGPSFYPSIDKSDSKWPSSFGILWDVGAAGTEGLAVESRAYPVGFHGNRRNPALGAAVVPLLVRAAFSIPYGLR